MAPLRKKEVRCPRRTAAIPRDQDTYLDIGERRRHVLSSIARFQTDGIVERLADSSEAVDATNGMSALL